MSRSARMALAVAAAVGLRALAAGAQPTPGATAKSAEDAPQTRPTSVRSAGGVEVTEPSAPDGANENRTPRAWRIEPVVGTSFTMTRQSLTVRDSEGSVSASRSSTAAVSATLGVRYAAWSRRVWLHSFASVGEELADLHTLVGLHQHALYRFGLTPWLELRAGLGLSVTLDVTQTAFSSGSMSILGGVQLWRFELLWSPALQVPLGGTSRTVADTEIIRKMAMGILPLSFALRFSFGP